MKYLIISILTFTVILIILFIFSSLILAKKSDERILIKEKNK